MNRKYFNRAVWFFFILFGAMCLLLWPYLADKLFSDNVVQEIENEREREKKLGEWLQEDSTDKASSTGMKKIVWRWQDFDAGLHKISFEVNEQALSSITDHRELMDLGTNPNSVYSHLYSKSLPSLNPIIEALKTEIKKSNFSTDEAYIKSLEMVVSAVQFIPYTLILDNNGRCPCEMPFGSFSGDCAVQENGRGCCAGIMPFGVYAPAEFMFHKKGDCDTRSLFAYSILSQMGFDVAVMISIQQGHSVLGVHLKNKNFPAYGTAAGGKKYFLWELTARDCPLGRGVNGSDWESALNKTTI